MKLKLLRLLHILCMLYVKIVHYVFSRREDVLRLLELFAFLTVQNSLDHQTLLELFFVGSLGHGFGVVDDLILFQDEVLPVVDEGASHVSETLLEPLTDINTQDIFLDYAFVADEKPTVLGILVIPINRKVVNIVDECIRPKVPGLALVVFL